MKIYRDGKEIELTAEELRMAYEEKHMEYFVADVKGCAESMDLKKSSTIVTTTNLHIGSTEQLVVMIPIGIVTGVQWKM